MKISRVIIENFRNLKNVDVECEDVVVLVGSNNSGKSNFLKAISLPFNNEDIGYFGKYLSWKDINKESRDRYYNFIFEKKDEILDGRLPLKEFERKLPIVKVEVHFKPGKKEFYYVKDFAFAWENESPDDDIKFGLRYEFLPRDSQSVFNYVKEVLDSQDVTKERIDELKLNLLPIDLYYYRIIIPNKSTVDKNVLKQFKYSSLEAERDEFTKNKNKIGYGPLVNLLSKNTTTDDKIKLENSYNNFFKELQDICKIEEIFNWHNQSTIEGSTHFFKDLQIVPNMPSIYSMLNSVTLGYDEVDLNLQGLGHRNLLLLFLMSNTLLDSSRENKFNILSLEEPEAHLCINNIRLMISYLKCISEEQKIQLFYSTHSSEFINKIKLGDVIVMNKGYAYSLRKELGQDNLDYLTKNPNNDLFKLFFSRRCILCEGLTEELLIRAYIQSRQELSDIDVIAFHKGYKDIIKIWKKINNGSLNRLGVLRDNDGQKKAKKDHEALRSEQVCIETTEEYTLEPEILKTGDNLRKLKDRYGKDFGWSDKTLEQIDQYWRDDKKSYVMWHVCKDIRDGNLKLEMPRHIAKVLEFLKG